MAVTVLQTNYKGQLIENLALPTILIATQIKLQQELDLHMLAEETKCKLEQEIKQVWTRAVQYS